MGRKLTKLTQLHVVAITLLILLISFGVYYIFYVSSQKTYFTNRSFRLLAGIGNQMKLTIENLGTSLKNAASSAKSVPKEVNLTSKDSVAEFIHARVKGSLSLVPNLKLTDCSPEANPSVIEGNISSPEILFNTRQEGETFWLYIDYRGWLYFDYTGSKDAGFYTIEIHARSDLNELFEPFISRGVFDEVLLAEEDGGVIFQRTKSKLSVAKLGKFLDKEGAQSEFTSINPPASFYGVRLAGTSYNLFLQPLQISLSGSGTTGDQGIVKKWVICGLVRSDRFHSEIHAIPYAILIIFIFLVLLIFLSLPFLKLWFMGPKDRLRASDVYFLVFSVFMGSALLTFVFLDTYAYVNLRMKTDDQLKKFSDNICKNLTTEVIYVLRELGMLNDQLAHDIEELENLKEKENVRKATDILDRMIHRDDPYPYLNMAFWTDSGGQQRIKWSVRKHTTPFINVSSRDYFKKAKEDHLWEITDREKNKKYRFWLEPIYSLNTGENTAILSMRMAENSPAWVASIDTRLLSLIQTVLPPGFGYCVIENDGKVLFHSDETRNLRENFFEECDNDRLLLSAVFGRKNEFVNTQYLGRGHRLYARPVDDFPWSLVVYRDKQILGTANLDILSISVILFVFYSLGLFIIFGLIYPLNAGDQARWLWPDKNQAGSYNLLLIINFLFCVLLFREILTSHGWRIFFSSLAFPFLGMVLAALILKKGPILGKRIEVSVVFKQWNLLPYRAGYVFMMFSLLILIGVLPSFGFFKIIHDAEMKLLVKHGQFNLAVGLKERFGRVKDRYDTVTISGQKADWLEKRLNLKWDVYDSFFFDTSVRETECPFKRNRISHGYFRWFLTKTRPLYNQTSVELSGLTPDASADELWQWEKSSSASLFLCRKGYDRGGKKDSFLHISSTIPILEIPKNPLWWIGPMILLAILFFVVRSMVQRVFLLNLDEPLSSYNGDLSFKSISQNLFVLRSPFAGGSELLKRTEFTLIDLREVAKEEGWSETFTYEEVLTGKDTVIVIDHLEYRMNDYQCNLEKLQLLEELLVYGRTMIVSSMVDPANFCFKAGARDDRTGKTRAEDNQMDRWTAVLKSFVKISIEDTGTPEDFLKDMHREQMKILSDARDKRMRKRLTGLFHVVNRECQSRIYLQNIGKEITKQIKFKQLTPQELLQQISDRACTYYHAIWALCSRDEKLALFYLAQDGLLSFTNHDIRRLMRRGLIVREPGLRLMNESFRRFVLSESHPDQVVAWRKGARSSWDTLKGPLLMGLMGVALFIFITQQDVFNSTVTLLSTFTGMLPVLFKLIGLFQRGKIGSSAEV